MTNLYLGGEYLDKDLIIRARRANIEIYLKSIGKKLLKEGNQYRVVDHSGLLVSGNMWYSHTLQKGGNTLDYLIEIEGISFHKAVEILLHLDVLPIQNNEGLKDKNIVIPERNVDDRRVIAYLAKARGLSMNVIVPLIKQGRIYESAVTHNCVITGADDRGIVRYIMQRSTFDECSFKYESKGSDKRYSFSLKGQSDIICVFESPIDLLSYITLQTSSMAKQPHMLSLGGVTGIALDGYLDRTCDIHKIVFALDNDKVGHQAYRLLSEKYSGKGYKVYKHFPCKKDWNEQLLSDKC